MKTRIVLFVSLAFMAVMIFVALLFPDVLESIMLSPKWYNHVLFLHVFTVTLFFANAVVGMLWEARSLYYGDRLVILHTYRTVAWLDAHFSSPLIIFAVTSGILLGYGLGGIWDTGWLGLSFILFLFSGVVWVVSDIPTQYRIKDGLAKLDASDAEVPEDFLRLLKMRVFISLAGVVPLVVIFALMIYKPAIPPVYDWF